MQPSLQRILLTTYLQGSFFCICVDRPGPKIFYENVFLGRVYATCTLIKSWHLIRFFGLKKVQISEFAFFLWGFQHFFPGISLSKAILQRWGELALNKSNIYLRVTLSGVTLEVPHIPHLSAAPDHHGGSHPPEQAIPSVTGLPRGRLLRDWQVLVQKWESDEQQKNRHVLLPFHLLLLLLLSFIIIIVIVFFCPLL